MASDHRRQWLVLGITATLLVAVFTLSVAWGPVKLSFAQVWEAIMGRLDGMPRTIVWNLRLPRVLVGMAVGASMAMAGAILQGVMRNSLADPHIIGVSAGAGFAAIAAMTLFPGALSGTVPAFAFIGAMTGAAVVYLLAWRGGVSPARMILAGVAVSSLMNAGTQALLLLFSWNVQSSMTWLVGGLLGKSWPEWARIWPYTLAGGTAAMLMSRQLNVLLLGDEMAGGLGIRVERSRVLLVALASILAGSAVSVAGLIGFVGLIVPHITRILVGSDYRFLLPVSAVMGAELLVLADTFARTAFDPAEIPVGIITSVMGAPFFLYLLRKRGR